ncbi:hypothetical protein YC2023_073205 [Brassica napus]
MVAADSRARRGGESIEMKESQRLVANSSLIHCGRQNGTQQSRRNHFGHFKKASLQWDTIELGENGSDGEKKFEGK